MPANPNPFLTRISKRGASGHGKTSEKRVAKALSARLTPASGAITGAKGDMNTPTMMIEAKSTVNASISIDLGWLVKVATEALSMGKTPALTVSFVMPDGKARQHGDWVMVPSYVWDSIMDEGMGEDL